MHGLTDFLRDIPQIYCEQRNSIEIKKTYLSPGYWAALCAFANYKAIPNSNVCILNEDTQGYASAIGFSKALWNKDDYQPKRRNQGKNYSTLESIASEEAVNTATSNINSCIRNNLSFGNDSSWFTRNLCNIVGDLHDNISSHSNGTGFSIAQKWKASNKSGDYFIEFSLADSGIGFLRELHRVGLNDILTDEEAIKWCIQEAHSSKLVNHPDEWAQHVPDDIMNNPMRGSSTYQNGNHHQGLGLYKLLKLIDIFKGELWLTTGFSLLRIDKSGWKSYRNVKNRWQGVAIACRFQSSLVSGITETEADRDTMQIIGMLRGD